MMRRLVLLLAMLTPSMAVLGAERSVTLAVENMTCAACPITVRAAIKGVVGVTDVKVDFAKKIAVVVFDATVTTSDKVAAASLNAGFRATVKE